MCVIVCLSFVRIFMSAFLPHALRYVSDGEKNEFVENSVFEKRKPNKSLNPSGFRRNICIGLYFILFHFIVSLSLSLSRFLFNKNTIGYYFSFYFVALLFVNLKGRESEKKLLS